VNGSGFIRPQDDLVMPSVLIFGRNGQVATELAKIAPSAFAKVTFLGRAECDLSVPGSALNAIRSLSPDLVINASAYTAVDKAESEREAAVALNASAPGEMAGATAAIGAPLIHISTDYVFDGRAPGAYRETDLCAPLSVYGSTKLAGEIAIRERNSRHIILRTSWVFSPHGTNFVRTMLRLGAEREELMIVSDQTGGPTAAADIAGTIMKIAAGAHKETAAFGTYHYTGAPVTTWYDFARAIFDYAAAHGIKTPKAVRPIVTADYPTAAVRPQNSTLDCRAIHRDWGIEQPLWQSSLTQCVDALVKTTLT
jgi:dTDP-4-dehydrorhamnose reductase